MNAGIAPVSVVIPCFRCAGTIARAIESVAAQTLCPAEVILVDDHSGDGTLAALERLASLDPRNRIRIITLPENLGAASARNRGWETATQPFIAFLDADDVWHPRKVEIQYRHLRANPDVALSAHGSMRLDTGERISTIAPLPDPVAPQKVGRMELLLSNRFITPSVMLRRDLPLRFREGRRHMEDHLLWLRVACSGLRIEKLPLPLAFTYKPAFGSAGLSAQMLPMARGDLENYLELRREGLIGRPLAFGLCLYSLAKSGRRLLIHALSLSRRVPEHP